MVLIWVWPLLYVACIIGLLICLVRKSWRKAALFAVAIGLFYLPPLIHDLRLWMKDVDYEYRLSDGSVDVRNRGPIPFTLTRSPNPYGGRYFNGTTTLADGAEIGFRVSGLFDGTSRTNNADCVTQAGPYGLFQRTFDGNSGLCRPTRNSTNYSWNIRTDEFSSIRCNRPETNTYCVLDFRHNTMQVSVPMWEVHLSRWEEARDHVVSILDQSFTPRMKVD